MTTKPLSSQIKGVRQVFNVRDYGAVGDGSDEGAEIQACIDAAGDGGVVVFPKTATNVYGTSVPLTFYNGQTWLGSGGIDVVGLGTELRLLAAGTSVVEPDDPTTVTYGFNPVGLYFNAQGFGDAGLSLYNTSYALVDQCAANATKAGAAAFLLDSDTSKQCYFNKLNQPRAFATGVGGVGIRFTRGANSNQVFGGKCGSSTRGMEFLSLSAANTILGTDFEDNTDCHVYIDAPTNTFIATHMESCPVGFEITADGDGTTRIGTTFATTVTDQVDDASQTGAVLECRNDAAGTIGELVFGSARFGATYLSGTSQLTFDPFLVGAASNALINFFLNTTTSGSRELNLYRGDGTSTLAISLNAGTGAVYVGDMTQENGTTGIARKLVRRSAVPTTGSWVAGDVVRRTTASAANPVTEWTCVADGTPGTWRASAWIVGSGATASRPTLTANDVGVQYLDTTLAAAGKPIWWTGSAWVDNTGTAV